ncbi:hypothetical protein FHR22_003221 [Sphingopyxis panaciterrae]|uniref:hypothetical protein n=1 Tax=Sphingopyxis panaciterrae TaxID=363841 RepID=UPI0014218FBF|nr:hypothetical protein [Sphingopyxis panaciterrae]NIJ38510.1 hypothetical protein [Sphingopyxis panaciterrae]
MTQAPSPLVLRDLSACFECSAAAGGAAPRAMRILVAERDRDPSEPQGRPAGPQTSGDLFALGRFWP